MDERGVGVGLEPGRELEGVAAPHHVGAKRVLVGVVEGDRSGAVDDVGDRLAKLGLVLFRQAEARLLDVAGDEPELTGGRPDDPEALQELGAPAGPGSGRGSPPWSAGRAPSRAGPHRSYGRIRRSADACERSSLPRKPVAPVRRTSSRGPPSPGSEAGPRVLPKPLDSGPDLTVAELGRLSELERDLGIGDPEEALGVLLHLATTGGGPEGARHLGGQEVEGRGGSPERPARSPSARWPGSPRTGRSCPPCCDRGGRGPAAPPGGWGRGSPGWCGDAPS